MTFIPVPNGIQLCFLFTTDSQNWQFCLMLQKSAGAPTSTDLAQATADGSAWWTSHLKALLAPGTTLNEIIATNMTAQGAPQDRALIGEVGTQIGNELPLNACAVVSHRTEKRGRSYRGRSYLSGITSNQINSVTTLNGTATAAFANGFAALRTLLDGHGLDQVVASRQHNGVPTSPADTNEVIVNVVDSLIDSQRRRLAGRGT